jgi:hypothetical protein
VSSGEVLSFRQINAIGSRKFRSVTPKSDTPGGCRHCEAVRAELFTTLTLGSGFVGSATADLPGSDFSLAGERICGGPLSISVLLAVSI